MVCLFVCLFVLSAIFFVASIVAGGVHQSFFHENLFGDPFAGLFVTFCSLVYSRV